VDSLHGDLTGFPLPRVLGMLARSGRTGVLRVEAGRWTGRIYLVEGDLVHATTREGDAAPPAAERRRRGAAPAGDGRCSADAVLRRIADVYRRLDEARSGRFWFVDGVTTRAYGDRSPERHRLEEVLALAARRREAWRSIRRHVPDETTAFRLRPTLEAAAVTVAAAEWEVLAATGEGASAVDLGGHLGIDTLAAASVMAELVRRGLLVPVVSSTPSGGTARTIELRVAPAGTAGGPPGGPSLRAPRR